jgi:hypothetical protein
MDVVKPLETEILIKLVEGRRTATELCESIYSVEKSNPSFHTYYMKVSRAVKELQRRGFVSTRVFGRDKPYTLTPIAAAHMMNVGNRDVRVVPIVDAVAYISAAVTGLASLFLIISSGGFDNQYTMVAYSLFLVLVGFSSARLYNAYRKVS